MVPVELRRLLIDQRRDEHAVYLHEKGGARGFPIVIGIFEATALDRLLKGRRSARPLTHDLLAEVIQRLGGTLVQVEIDRAVEDCYHAKLRILADGREHLLDARPSDALALALALDAPILVDDGVFAAASSA
jgi:hypothetical protein